MRPVYKTKTVTERVYNRLKKAIIKNDLLPGQTLTIEGLAQGLGVSRTPVREALLMLKQEGLVEGDMISGRGTFVAGLTHDDLQEIFEVREAVELFAIQVVIDRIRASQLQNMRKKLEQHLSPTNAQEVASAAEADLEFHRAIVEATGNKRLREVWNQLAVQFRRFWDEGRTSSDRAKEDIQDCLKVIASLEQGESEQAMTALKQHLEKTRKAISSWWPKKNNQ